MADGKVKVSDSGRPASVTRSNRSRDGSESVFEGLSADDVPLPPKDSRPRSRSPVLGLEMSTIWSHNTANTIPRRQKKIPKVKRHVRSTPYGYWGGMDNVIPSWLEGTA